MSTSDRYLARWIVQRVAPSLRRKRIQPLIDMINQCADESGSVQLIDVGGTSGFWRIIPSTLLERGHVHVTIVNLPGVEVPRQEGVFTYHDCDGCDLTQFRDGQFDIAFSNSVIEHVGDWMRMRLFANEVRRVAHRYFVQTPNFWFPVEPHCMTPVFHWLPFATRVWLLLHFDFGHWRGRRTVDKAVATAESARLLNVKMMKELFPEASIHKERLFLLPKSIIAIKA